MLGAAHVIHGVVEVLGDMKLVEDDLGLCCLHMLPRGLNVGLPHVHGDRGDPCALDRAQGLPEPIQTLLLPILGQVEDAAAIQVGDHGEVAVLLGEGVLIDAQVRHDVLGASAQSPVDGLFLDPLGLIPRNAQQPRGPLHRALPEQVDGQPLEQGRELAAGFGPGNGNLLDSVCRTCHPAPLGLNSGGQLVGIQVPPPAGLPIIAGPQRLASGTWVRLWPGIVRHNYLLSLHIQFHVSPRFSFRRPEHSGREVSSSHNFLKSPQNIGVRGGILYSDGAVTFGAYMNIFHNDTGDCHGQESDKGFFI